MFSSRVESDTRVRCGPCGVVGLGHRAPRPAPGRPSPVLAIRAFLKAIQDETREQLILPLLIDRIDRVL
jgi:hypothetical protein